MSTRIFIRTHYFDRTVEALHAKWSRLLPGGVFILMDDTRGPVDTGGLPKVSFDLAALAARGLPAWPQDKAAWYCGDYVMAAVEPHLGERDFAIVVENDAVPGIAGEGRWREVLDAMGRHDLAAYRYRLRQPSWQWLRSGEAVYGPGRKFGALVILLGFTRATAAHMTRRRIEIAAAREAAGAGRDDDWPHCELFVGAEAKAAGMRVADLGTLLPQVEETLTTLQPYWFDDVIGDDSVDTLYHPVTDQRSKFLLKMRVMIRKRYPPEAIEARLARIAPLAPDEARGIERLRERIEREGSEAAT